MHHANPFHSKRVLCADYDTNPVCKQPTPTVVLSMLSLYLTGAIADTGVVIEKVVTKRHLHDRSGVKEDLQYWLSRTPEERVNAVDFLWMQLYGPGPRRIQRVVKVIHFGEEAES